MLKFDQKEVTTKEFYGQRQITDTFTIDVNKLAISDKVPCNNGKDYRYIVGYQADGALIPLFIKTPKNVFSYGLLQYDKNSAYTVWFNVSEEKECVLQYRNIWNEVGSQPFEKLSTEPLKGKYIHGKLKTWKERMRTNFHAKDVPYDMYCNATAVLKMDSVYKQSENDHPQAYFEEYKYTNVENKKCNMLSDDDDNDDGFFEV